MPALVVPPVHIGQAVAEIAVVVLDVWVMHLQPNPRYVDSVDMRREPAVSLVYVGADILDAGNHVLAVFFRLVQVPIAKIFVVDAGKSRLVVINAVSAEFVRNHIVDCRCHRRIEGRTLAPDQIIIVDLEPDPELYRAIVEELPDVVIEDAWLEDGLRDALAGAEDRLSFDAPVHSLEDLDDLPLEPHWLNIKPSRFGTLRGLLECIEACEARGVRMYGGGQFELGVGRRQIQTLASVFYADGPNDTAPGAFNEGDPRPGLPSSPLPASDAVGF